MSDSELFDVAACLAYAGFENALVAAGGVAWAIRASLTLARFGCFGCASLTLSERGMFYQLVSLALQDEDSADARAKYERMIVR